MLVGDLLHLYTLVNLTLSEAVAPWFSPTHYGGGGYLKVHQMVGDMIDWYNVQVSSELFVTEIINKHVS